MADKVCDCLIIGGGASGLFAAASLIKESNGSKSITILESGSKTGRKLLLTGSGRCNLTNKNCNTSKYNTDDPAKLEKVLSTFTPDETIAFFEQELGVLVTQKGDLFYPSTFKSSTVTDALRLYVEDAGTDIITDANVSEIIMEGGNYHVTSSSGDVFAARKVILATGGASYPGTGSDGTGINLIRGLVSENDILPFTPALVPLTSDKKNLKQLAGVRCSCRVKVVSDGKVEASSEGEVLFTKDGGVSGICIMDVSYSALSLIDSGRNASVVLDMMLRQPQEVFELLKQYRDRFSSRKASDAFSGLINRSILEAVMTELMLDPVDPAGNIKDARLMQLANALCGWEIRITGSEGFDNAQVSAGGVMLSALNDTLSVKAAPGLYIIGEVCNVNGICGGYNLQWAWASAVAAARDIAYV